MTARLVALCAEVVRPSPRPGYSVWLHEDATPDEFAAAGRAMAHLIELQYGAGIHQIEFYCRSESFVARTGPDNRKGQDK